MTVRKHDDARASCECRRDRRTFLGQAAVIAGAVVAGFGARAEAASLLPVGFGEATGRAGDELKYPWPTVDGATIDRDNGVIVARFQGKVCAFNLSCPHENAAVRWKPGEARFECSRHDSRYSPMGVYTSGRATRNMDRFSVTRQGETLIVNIARLIQSDRTKAEWDAAAIPG
jgi:Rieske Fe-S protein